MIESRRILEMVKKQRPYASHWEWPDKKIKERGIISNFLEARSRVGLEPYNSVLAQNMDPPDFKAIEISGRLIGIELTELVSEEAIHFNIKAKTPGQRLYRDWTQEDLVKVLQEKLDDKGSKKYYGRPYDEIHVVIFTDEPILTYRGFGEFLGSHVFKTPKQVHRAYVLFSYDPGTESYPLVELKLK